MPEEEPSTYLDRSRGVRSQASAKRAFGVSYRWSSSLTGAGLSSSFFNSRIFVRSWFLPPPFSTTRENSRSVKSPDSPRRACRSRFRTVAAGTVFRSTPRACRRPGFSIPRPRARTRPEARAPPPCGRSRRPRTAATATGPGVLLFSVISLTPPNSWSSTYSSNLISQPWPRRHSRKESFFPDDQPA